MLHTAWYDEGEIIDIPVYATYGNAIEDGAVPVPRHRARVPARARCPHSSLPALLSDDQRGSGASSRG